MSKVKMPMLSLSAHGKTMTPIDSSDIDAKIAAKNNNLIFQNWRIMTEGGWQIFCENKKKLQCEQAEYIVIYREQPTPSGRITIREKYYTPTDTWSQSKQDNRDKFAAAVLAWQNLTSEEQIVWNKMKYPYHMSGYNRFLRNYMLNN